MRKRSRRGKAIIPSDPKKGLAGKRKRVRRHRVDYHLAPASLIDSLAIRALNSYGGSIETQRKLYMEIADKLKGEDEDLRVSEARMREVLLSSPRVTVDVRYSMHDESPHFKACPVCRKPIIEVFNATLDGGKVIAGYKCTNCPFWTPLRRRVPSRYIFRIID